MIYSDWISQSCHDQRSLFRKANSLLGLRQEQVLTPHADNAALSKELANFFVLKVDNIRSTIDSNTSSSSATPSDNSSILSTNSKIYLRKKLFPLFPLLLINLASSILSQHPWSNHLYPS